MLLLVVVVAISTIAAGKHINKTIEGSTGGTSNGLEAKIVLNLQCACYEDGEMQTLRAVVVLYGWLDQEAHDAAKDHLATETEIVGEIDSLAGYEEIQASILAKILQSPKFAGGTIVDD